MNSFKNPLTPQIEEPVNIDRPIQELQNELATLGWLEKSFGRSFPSFRIDGSGKKLIYPEVWQGVGKDLLNVMPNDNLKSQSFFKVEEPIQVAEFVPGGYSQMKGTISIIFWFNLKEIDLDLDHRYLEILQAQAQKKITGVLFTPTSSIKILRIWHTAEQVFRGYDLTQTAAELFSHPYGGFRFECELSYMEDCPTSDPYTPPLLMIEGGFLAL